MSNITVKVLQDDTCDQDSPRDWDNLGTMACWHRSYTLGDEQPKCDPSEHQDELPEGTIILPLYLYDHSGITMSTGEFGCRWDSGQVGFIYVTPERILKEYGDTSDKSLENARKVLECEVDAYDRHLRGDVWGFVIEKHNECDSCHHVEPEHVDSCWGFYGPGELEAMKEHVEDEHHAALEAAWEAR